MLFRLETSLCVIASPVGAKQSPHLQEVASLRWQRRMDAQVAALTDGTPRRGRLTNTARRIPRFWPNVETISSACQYPVMCWGVLRWIAAWDAIQPLTAPLKMPCLM
jgi:hypothetical protein